MYNLNEGPRKGFTPGRIREEKIQGAMYISPERTRWSHRESKNPSRRPFTYSMRYFKILHSPLSFSPVATAVSILLYTLERTTRIVGSPGPPRMAIRGHRRLQPASKSGSSLSRSLSRGLRRPFSSRGT